MTDLVFQVTEGLPEWSQSLQASQHFKLPGGKGLNQAIAAARQGADVTLVAALGDDSDGDWLLAQLRADGVNTDLVDRQRGTTPTAAVFVRKLLREGIARTSVVGWKNANEIRISLDHLQKAESALASADCVLVSLEVPIPVVDATIRMARRGGAWTILHASPPVAYESLGERTLEKASMVVLSDWEAATLLGIDTRPASELAGLLRKRGVPIPCVLSDDLSCAVVTNGGVVVDPGFQMIQIDPTGTGDAFCATFGVVYASIPPDASARRAPDLTESLAMANAARALASSTFGASVSMPSTAMIEALMEDESRRAI